MLYFRSHEVILRRLFWRFRASSLYVCTFRGANSDSHQSLLVFLFPCKHSKMAEGIVAWLRREGVMRRCSYFVVVVRPLPSHVSLHVM